MTEQHDPSPLTGTADDQKPLDVGSPTWHRLAQYVATQSKARLSHGICEACESEKLAD